MSHRILIVGGGIGGLTAAIALIRGGHTVEVVEQSPVLAAVGAGITIQANATAVFDALGIELLAEDIGPIGYFEMINGAGKRLMSGDPADADVDFPSINIHRADLQSTLVGCLEARGGALQLGRKVVSVTPLPDGEQVEVEFADGETGRWDLVVGFDGLYSAVRASLLGADSMTLRYAEQTCWRFAFEAPDLIPDITVERWSTQRRIGMVPLSRGRIYVYMVESAPEGSPSPNSSSAAGLKAKFDGVDDRLDPILARLEELESAGNPVPIHHGDLYEQPQISFGRDRVVLLGDAAHGMTPNMGQGAGTAIEDAAELGLLLAKDDSDISDLPRALERARRTRVRQIQKMSWRIGAMAHIKNRFVCWLRDLLLGLMPASMSKRQMTSLWQPGIDLADALRKATPPRVDAPESAE